jgi:uncharacterized protein YbjT (DUF2867 family)
MRVAMIGATGLVGSLVAPRLLAQGHQIDALLRWPSGVAHSRLREHVAPAEAWPAIAGALDVEAAVSALGTTMRDAGSEAAFRTVDLDTVVGFASAAAAAGARRMISISSVGADPASANFYLRIKGEMEAALEALGFERLDIFRPGLLRGPRGRHRRLGERIGILLSPLVNPLLRGPLDRFAAIDADSVAAAVVNALGQTGRGTFRHGNREMLRMA